MKHNINRTPRPLEERAIIKYINTVLFVLELLILLVVIIAILPLPLFLTTLAFSTGYWIWGSIVAGVALFVWVFIIAPALVFLFNSLQNS